MTKATTERSNYAFVVKEFPDGQPWIELEAVDSSLRLLGKGFLGLDLRKGTTLKQAQSIAHYLREHITTVSYTELHE